MKFKTLRDESRSGNIELFGNKRVIIDGCKGVSDYSKDFLKLDLGYIQLKITGSDLVIESYIYEQAELTGEIISVEFTN